MIHLTHIFQATYFQAKVEEIEKYIFLLHSVEHGHPVSKTRFHLAEKSR